MKKYYLLACSALMCFFISATTAVAQTDTNALQLSLDKDYAVLFGTETISGTLLNTGLNTINSAVINWQLDNGEIYSHAVNNLNLTAGHIMNFNHPQQWSATPGKYTLKVWASEINGIAVSNIIEKPIQVASGMAQRQPLIEKFTSSTCPPCAGYNPIFNNWATNPDNVGKFTYVNYQMNWPGAGDPYYTAEAGVRRGYYNVGGVPSVYFSGKFAGNTPGQGVLNAYLNHADYGYGKPEILDIEVDFEMNGTEITVDYTITPYADSTGLTVHVVVLEEMTTGNVGSNGETEFKRVMMKLIPGPNGETVDFEADVPFTRSHTVDLADTFIEEFDDLDVIVFVQNNLNEKRLIQARSVNHPPVVGIEDFTQLSFKLYPNPSDGILNIAVQETVSVEVYDLTGKLVYTKNNINNNAQLDLTFLHSGIYLAKVTGQESSVTQKIVIK